MVPLGAIVLVWCLECPCSMWMGCFGGLVLCVMCDVVDVRCLL